MRISGTEIQQFVAIECLVAGGWWVGPRLAGRTNSTCKLTRDTKGWGFARFARLAAGKKSVKRPCGLAGRLPHLNRFSCSGAISTPSHPSPPACVSPSTMRRAVVSGDSLRYAPSARAPPPARFSIFQAPAGAYRALRAAVCGTCWPGKMLRHLRIVDARSWRWLYHLSNEPD